MEKKNVTTAKPKIGGAIHRAPLGTQLPTDATTVLAEGFVDIGYSGEDGVKNITKSSSDQTKAWGGDIVLVQKHEAEDTFELVLLESLNVETLKMVYGSENVIGTLESGITVKVNDDDPEDYIYVIEMILKGGVAKRIVIPEAHVSEVGEIVYKDDDLIAYKVKLSANKDASGNTHYEYIKGGK